MGGKGEEGLGVSEETGPEPEGGESEESEDGTWTRTGTVVGGAGTADGAGGSGKAEKELMVRWQGDLMGGLRRSLKSIRRSVGGAVIEVQQRGLAWRN